MIAPKMIGLVRSPFGFALWNKDDFLEQEADECYIRASDAVYLLSVIDSLIEANGGELDLDDSALIAQIRADLAKT